MTERRATKLGVLTSLFILPLAAAQAKMTEEKTTAPELSSEKVSQAELVPSAPAAKEEKVEDFFRTHITSGTSNPRPWHVAYQRFPGALFSENFLMNSLSIGLTDNIQVGSVPLLYLGPTKIYNLNGKFVSSKAHRVGKNRLYFGMGASGFTYKIDHDPFRDRDGTMRSRSQFFIFFYGASAVYVTSREWLSFGAEFEIGKLSSDSERLNEEINKNQSPVDFMFDTSVRYSPHFFQSFGVGWTRSQSFAVLSADRIFGAGSSLIWAPKYAYLDSLSLGCHYFPSTQKPYLMIGASF